MATTGATGNQGSTGDQDPEPQQEILATGAGIRPPAMARAGDAGRPGRPIRGLRGPPGPERHRQCRGPPGQGAPERRPSKRTWADCLISTRTTPRTPDRCLLKNRALASITPSRRRRLSWLSPRLPTALATKAGNAGTTRMKRRSGGCTGQGPFIQRPEPARR